MEGSDGTNWLDVLKASFWPLLAAVTLALFYGPLARLAESASGKPASSIEVAGLKIVFDTTANETLRRPPPEIARLLAQLRRIDIDALLAAGDGFLSVCPLDERYRSYGSVNNPRLAQRFLELGLVTRKNVEDGRLQCEREFLVTLSPIGTQAREYLVEVLAKTVTISPAD